MRVTRGGGSPTSIDALAGRRPWFATKVCGPSGIPGAQIDLVSAGDFEVAMLTAMSAIGFPF